MTDKKKADPKASPKNAPTPGNVCRHDTSASPAELLDKAPTKAARVLVYLRHFGPLNRFEAARLVGDTCLNSTIPALESRHRLAFEHTPEKSPNNWGEPCDCTRYRLPASEHDKTDKVLALMFDRTKGAA